MFKLVCGSQQWASHSLCELIRVAKGLTARWAILNTEGQQVYPPVGGVDG